MKDLDKLTLRERDGAVVLAVKVVPAASRDRVVGVLGDCLKITTAAPAEKGKANKAVAAILAKALGADRGQVELLAGHGSARKEFRIRGVSASEIRAALQRL